MIKKTIKFTDFEGNEREESFHFNLTQAEVLEMEMEIKGGLSKHLTTIVESNNEKEIIASFKDLIRRSYGVKSNDGRKFIKSQEVLDDFIQTEAYSVLFMELATNADAAAIFVDGIVPQVK